MDIVNKEPPEPQTSQPEIIEARPGDIPDADLEKLVRNLVESQIDESYEITADIREKIGVSTPKELIEKMQERRLTYAKEILEQGKILACRTNGKIAAMVGWDKVYDLPDGRKAYTIEMASTLPEFQGRGYYKLLAAAAFEKIRKVAPQAPIFAMTKSERVKNYRRELPGWREYALDDPNPHPIVEAYKANKPAEFIQREIAEGYVIFVFDPKDLSS